MRTMQKCHDMATFGGPGDSFYEYILKYYLLAGKKDTEQRDWLQRVSSGLKKSLVYRQENAEMPVMMVEKAGSRQVKKMGHLACFSGGFWGLTSKGPTQLFLNL